TQGARTQPGWGIPTPGTRQRLDERVPPPPTPSPTPPPPRKTTPPQTPPPRSQTTYPPTTSRTPEKPPRGLCQPKRRLSGRNFFSATRYCPDSDTYLHFRAKFVRTRPQTYKKFLKFLKKNRTCAGGPLLHVYSLALAEIRISTRCRRFLPQLL